MSELSKKERLINIVLDSSLRDPIKLSIIDSINNSPVAALSNQANTLKREIDMWTQSTRAKLQSAHEITDRINGLLL